MIEGRVDIDQLATTGATWVTGCLRSDRRHRKSDTRGRCLRRASIANRCRRASSSRSAMTARAIWDCNGYMMMSFLRAVVCIGWWGWVGWIRWSHRIGALVETSAPRSRSPRSKAPAQERAQWPVSAGSPPASLRHRRRRHRVENVGSAFQQDPSGARHPKEIGSVMLSII